jgi:hypothetical protein
MSYRSRAAVIAMLGLTLFAQPAWTQSNALKDSFLGRALQKGRGLVMPVVARFQSENGTSFVLDHSSERPLIRFDGSPEVWVLHTQYAPRGDVLYRNDSGRIMARSTRIGGLTLFTSDRPMGVAAASLGAATPLRLPTIGPQQLLRQLASSSARASRAAERLIPIDADATPSSSALIGDAAMICAEAIVRLAKDPKGRPLLNRIRRITLEEGSKPQVSLRDGELIVTVAPELGLAGRPSSERIAFVSGLR